MYDNIATYLIYYYEWCPKYEVCSLQAHLDAVKEAEYKHSKNYDEQYIMDNQQPLFSRCKKCRTVFVLHADNQACRKGKKNYCQSYNWIPVTFIVQEIIYKWQQQAYRWRNECCYADDFKCFHGRVYLSGRLFFGLFIVLCVCLHLFVCNGQHCPIRHQM